MICIELSFSDDPRRLVARPAHRAIALELHTRGVLVAAGPWADESGALIILDTDQAGAEAVLADDPYSSGPGVTVVSVRSWSPVVGP